MIVLLNTILLTFVWLVLGVFACKCAAEWIASRRGLTFEQFSAQVEAKFNAKGDSGGFGPIEFILLVLWPLSITLMVVAELLGFYKDDTEENK